MQSRPESVGAGLVCRVECAQATSTTDSSRVAVPARHEKKSRTSGTPVPVVIQNVWHIQLLGFELGAPPHVHIRVLVIVQILNKKPSEDTYKRGVQNNVYDHFSLKCATLSRGGHIFSGHAARSDPNTRHSVLPSSWWRLSLSPRPLFSQVAHEAYK